MNMKNNQPTKLEHQRKRRGRNKDEDIYMNYKRKREKSNQSIDTELILKTDDLQVKKKTKHWNQMNTNFEQRFAAKDFLPLSETPPHTYTDTESSWSCRAMKEETNGGTEENKIKPKQITTREKSPLNFKKELVTINRTSCRAIRTRMRRDVKMETTKTETDKQMEEQPGYPKTGKLKSRREKNM